MATSVEAWQEWHERCALGLCGEPAQRALKAFAWSRFDTLARRYLWRTNRTESRAVTPAADACWHLFETRLTASHTREGKRYKDWLFSRSAPQGEDETLDVIQGGATLLMRDVVRDHLRREHPPAHITSLQEPSGREGGFTLTLEDLLPGTIDPVCEVEQREFEQLAATHAEASFALLNRRERVAVLAKALQLSVAHPACAEVAGCSKSSLNNAYREGLERVATRMQADYAAEDPSATRVLTLMTLEALTEHALVWGKLGNSCAPLFKVQEEADALHVSGSGSLHTTS